MSASRVLPRRTLYPLVGALFALGAPMGLLAVRFVEELVVLSPAWVWDELASDRITYLYLVVSTQIAFVALGFMLGARMDELRAISIHDELTGLFNRRYFRTRIDPEIKRSVRYGAQVSVLLIDVDRLKEINDEMGHGAGDRALEIVAEAIRRNLRASDVAARLGGDEFAILLPHTSAREAVSLARRVQAWLIEAPFGDKKRPSISAGAADLESAHVSEAGALLLAADVALYEAKRAGRNRVVSAHRPWSPRLEAEPVQRQKSRECMRIRH